MCGAYTLTNLTDPFKAALGVGRDTHYGGRFNIRPTQYAPLVRIGSDGHRETVQFRWGLVPYWSRGAIPKYATFNARAEAVASTSTYREPFKSRRCLVLADGFYEWQQTNERQRQPWRITLTDGEGFAMAGLWDSSGAPGAAEPILSYTIITTAANDLVSLVDDRMPVILPPSAYGAWLGDEPGADTQELLRPYPTERMTAYRVGNAVNNWRNQDQSLIEPAER